MNASRSLHRPNVLLVVEAMLVVAVLCFVSAIAPVRALDPGPAFDPSPAAPPTADPCASEGPAVPIDPAASTDPAASIDPAASPDPSASPKPDGGLHIDHVWVDMIDPETGVGVPGAFDAPEVGVERGRLYVVRFQLVNDSKGPIDVLPVIEFGGIDTPDAWTVVPAVDPVDGLPFYTSANVRRGERPGTQMIAIADLRLAMALPAITPVEPVPCGTDQDLPTEPAATQVPAATDPAPSPSTDAGAPLVDPTLDPTVDPTVDPSFDPTAAPTVDPTLDPAPAPASTPAPTSSAKPAALPVAGVAQAGVNPGPGVTLVGRGFTELAFTVRATADAAWLATYTVRLSNGETPIPGAGVATLVMRDSPPVVLSPGQQSGIAVSDLPGDPLPMYPLRPPQAGVESLVAPANDAPAGDAALPAPGLLGPIYVSPHGPYSLTTDACAACHSSHTAQSAMLLVSPEPLSAMCFTCHGGTGASTNIVAQYSDPTVPANDPSTGSYYSHAATIPSSHTRATDSGEFAGVLNRHSACTDCHGPHLADATLASETSSGWTASGALMGASGVAVLNGPAGTAPTYTWKATSAFEYELCFKCHSGFTQLNPQTGGPSTWALDKAVELNPANLSYHPVEAAGTNQTAQMGGSLSGTSPYKLWTFTTSSTVRCGNCHGDSRLANPASPPAAGARLAPHAVTNRGMLISPLRDRLLKGPSDAYLAGDFALCYVCHAEAPFVDTSENPRLDTGFPLHGLHVADIRSFSGPSGGTVDDDDAGRGNALCAECHFRTHGTTYAVDGQTPASRLVNFAPNVQPYLGTEPAYAGKLLFDAPTQSCTLTCHGVNHRGWSY